MVKLNYHELPTTSFEGGRHTHHTNRLPTKRTRTANRCPFLDFTFEVFQLLYGLKPSRKHLIPHYGAKIPDRILPIINCVNIGSAKSSAAPGVTIENKEVPHYLWSNFLNNFEHFHSQKLNIALVQGDSLS